MPNGVMPIQPLQNQMHVAQQKIARIQTDMVSHATKLNELASKLYKAELTARQDLVASLTAEQRQIMDTQQALEQLRTVQSQLATFIQSVVNFGGEVHAAATLLWRLASAPASVKRLELNRLEYMESDLNAKDNTIIREAGVLAKEIAKVKKLIVDILRGREKQLAAAGIKNLNIALTEAINLRAEMTRIKGDVLMANGPILEETRLAARVPPPLRPAVR